MLQCSWVTRGLVRLDPFSHEIHRRLGLDCHLWDVGYVEPHEFESLLGDPPHGEAVSNNFPEPK
jgi:hypothetical protein